MKKVKRLIHQVKTGGVMKNLNRSRLYRAAATRYDLVYFGTVDNQQDEHVMVRGLTVSPAHQDRHYCVGSIEGFDVILLERTDQLFFPYKQPESYRWTILQVDLERLQLPHIFIDSHQHQSAFYDALFAKFPRMTRVDNQRFADHDPRFIAGFSVFCDQNDTMRLSQLFGYEVTATLGHHFSHFDFEIYDDHLLVYSANRIPTPQLMDHLFRAGIWLAREIEKANASASSSQLSQPDEAAPQRF